MGLTVTSARQPAKLPAVTLTTTRVSSPEEMGIPVSTCSWTRLLICRCCATTGAWSLGAENYRFSAVVVHRQGVDVPAIMQRRVSQWEVPQIQLIWWTPSLHRDRLQLGTWLRCVIRDRIFWGTCVSHKCRWCRSRREFYSQVTWHRDCQLDRSVVST